jgi:uncharacterized protein (DUF362 family)
MDRSRRALTMGLAAGAAGLAMAPLGCVGPIRSAPDPVLFSLPPRSGVVPVGVARAPLGAARAACEQAIEAAGGLPWMSRGDRVLLKVASNSGNAHPAVTSPSTVEAMAAIFRDAGARDVVVADQAGVGHVRRTETFRSSSTAALMARNGIAAAAARGGARLVCFDDLEWNDHASTRLDFDSPWGDALGVPRPVLEADHVVYLPRISAHALAGYTAGLKIAVGFLRDDARLALHQRASTFFERVADINHVAPLRERLRLIVTAGEAALLDIGPDVGSTRPWGGVVAIAAASLIDHDRIVSGMLPWLDRTDASFFDLYAPYPRHADWHNRGFVKDTWGEGALAAYEPMVPFPLGATSGAKDAALARLSRLLGRRPGKIALVQRGDALPAALVAHLRATLGDDLVA